MDEFKQTKYNRNLTSCVLKVASFENKLHILEECVHEINRKQRKSQETKKEEFIEQVHY